jgi:hypothetical protein
MASLYSGRQPPSLPLRYYLLNVKYVAKKENFILIG